MIDTTLEAIIERDRGWSGDPMVPECPEADRRALLAHINELEAITEEILRDFRSVKDLVRKRTTFDPGPDPPSITRTEYKRQWDRANALTGPQWRMLEELAEPNKNPENEWSFPHKQLRTGRRLVALGLAKEHDMNTHRCCFSITDAGRKRLARRGSHNGKLETRETP